MNRFRGRFGARARRSASAGTGERTRRSGTLPALCLLTVAAFTATSGAAYAATSSTAFDIFGFTSPENQVSQRFGERLTDANLGSGVRDLFASSYLATFNGMAGAGEVTLINGGDRTMRYQIHSPEPQENSYFGFYVADVGDVTGNGKEDVAVGAPYENVTAAGAACTAGSAGCNTAQGKIFVFEGATGQLLYAINSPHPQPSDPAVGAAAGPGGFGARISTAGDVTGDGVPDIITGAPGYDLPAGCSHLAAVPANCHKTEGEAYIMSGAGGAFVRTLDIPAADEPAAAACNPSCGRIGGSVATVGDINGDGVADQQVAAYSLKGTATTHGRVYLFSGANGSVLARIDPPVPGASQFFGLQDVSPYSPGDVNGDGVPDIYADAFTASGAAGPNQGRAWIFDGRSTVSSGTGQLLYEVTDPAPAPTKSFGFSASKTSYDGDGRPDLLVGGIGEDSEDYIFAGGTGALLKTLAMPAAEYQHGVTGNAGSEFGWSSRSLDDLNADCAPDYAISAPTEDVNGLVDQGKVYFFVSSVPGGCAGPAGPAAEPPPPPAATPPAPTPAAASPATTARPATVRLVVTVKHKRDRTLPYRYTAALRIVLPKGTSMSRVCRSGQISLQAKRGGLTLSTRHKTISRLCRATIEMKFAVTRRLGRHRPVQIKLTGRFTGNSFLRRATAKAVNVKAG